MEILGKEGKHHVLEALRSDPGIIRNKNKIYSVRKNAQIVKKIQKEFGSFDAYLVQ